MKLFKKSSDYSKSAAAMAAIEKFVKAKAMKFNPNTYEVYIMRELHWDNKDRTWRKNFVKNLKTFIDLRRIIQKKEPLDLLLKVYDIESGELLIEKVVS